MTQNLAETAKKKNQDNKVYFRIVWVDVILTLIKNS